MLTQKQKRWLRGKAHDLHPLVLVGSRGLTKAVITETGHALDHHEMVKVRLGAGDRDDRRHQAATLCQRTEAEVVQLIGAVVTLYRPDHDNPRLLLPPD